MDICFVKPQALLALSIAICAWRLAKVKRDSRSEILEEYSAHWLHQRGGDEILEPNARAEEGAWSRFKGSLMCIDWKSKEKKGETFQKDSTTYHRKETYLHKVQTLLTKVLGVHMTKGFLHQK
jgi:DNA relaxase NicK